MTTVTLIESLKSMQANQSGRGLSLAEATQIRADKKIASQERALIRTRVVTAMHICLLNGNVEEAQELAVFKARMDEGLF